MMLLALIAATLSQPAAGDKLTNDRQLSAATRQSLAQRALAICAAKDARVAVAVTGPDGIVRTLLTADGVPRVAVETARRKAISAALVGFSTSGLTKATVEAPAYVDMLRAVEPALVTIGGGVPVRVDGALVGAIGVGGASGPEADETCATQAIAAELGGAR